MIEISGHHMGCNLRSYGYGGCEGYSQIHTKFTTDLAREILVTASPEIIVLLLEGPDNICAICPRNITGKYYNIDIINLLGEKFCNPNESTVESNKIAIQSIERLINKPNGKITAGDFQEWRKNRDNPFINLN